jgi:glycosyltransferase involved in cell wall biosynthesis
MFKPKDRQLDIAPDPVSAPHGQIPAPQVSVLMPVFNTARYLAQALNSICTQTFGDFELIVVDDGSNDQSSQILGEISTQERRMRVFARENRGIISTRNELLSAARSEFVAWMDSDDVSLPTRLEHQVEAFRRDPALVCLGSAAQCIDPEGNFLNLERYPLRHDEILQEQQKGGAMRFPTTMMRREAALRVGGFREPFKIGEDFDLLLRLSETGKMANLPDTLYLYRQHVASACATLGPQWPVYRDQILKLAQERRMHGADRLQNGERLHIETPGMVGRRQTEWRVFLEWAGQALRNGNAWLAWKYARAALYRRPMSVAAWKVVVRIILFRLSPLSQKNAR